MFALAAPGGRERPPLSPLAEASPLAGSLSPKPGRPPRADGAAEVRSGMARPGGKRARAVRPMKACMRCDRCSSAAESHVGVAESSFRRLQTTFWS
eukprot:1967855-Alexandrium_andersonii.AAC.1